MCTDFKSAKKKLYILDIEAYSDEAIQFFKKCQLSSKDCLLIYNGDAQVDTVIEFHRPQTIYAKEVITLADVKVIDKFVKDLSRQWYCEFNPEYRGIELGSLVEYPFVLFLIQLLKDILIIDRAVKLKSPDKVTVITDRPCFPDFKEIFGLEWSIILTGKRESWKDRMLKDVARFDNKAYGLLRVNKVIRWFINKKKWVLMDTFFRPHVEEAFRKKGFEVIRLDENWLVQSAKSKRRMYLHLICYLRLVFRWPEILSSALIKRKALEDWDGTVELIRDRHQFNYENHDITSFICSELQDYRFKVIRPLLNYIDIWLRQLHGASSLKALLVSNDVLPCHKALVYVAKKLGIRSVMVQHGILGAVLAHDRLSVDIAAVWGNASRLWYQEYDNSRVNFKVIGNPHFDHYASLNLEFLEARQKQLREELDIEPAEKIVTFATQWVPLLTAGSFVDDTSRTLRAFIDSVVDIPFIKLIIRLHPAESEEDYKNVLNYAKKIGLKNRIIIDNKLSLLDVLIVSDAVAVISSTVGLEALFLRKPLIVINLSGRPDPVPYVDYNVAVGAYNEDEITKAIMTALESFNSPNAKQAQDRFIEEYAFKLDGDATARLIGLVDSLR